MVINNAIVGKIETPKIKACLSVALPIIKGIARATDNDKNSKKKVK